MELKAEKHFFDRIGWLRAAVLGANDGIVSTSSIIIGVVSAGEPKSNVLIAGVAALVAGAMSMAAGEYVSVSSQADSEKADLAREAHELEVSEEFEREELAQIYEKRGLTNELAKQVSDQLMAHDALDAHARDELSMHSINRARPLQAAFTSATAFTCGAALPLCIAFLSPQAYVNYLVSSGSILSLAALGSLSAYAGGANIITGVIRVTLWGALAMLVTAVIGKIFGTVV
jgi:VIT1/CCC1 family predicted Fe2+/Mn2+ transporter